MGCGRRDGPEGREALTFLVGCLPCQRHNLEDPLRDGQGRLCNGACPRALADCEQRIVQGAGCAGPRRDLDIAGRRAGELWLVHVPDFRVDPEVLVIQRAVAADIQHGDLGPEGMRVHVEVILGQDALAIHDGHVLGADGDEVLNAHVGKVFLEQEKGLLARLLVDAGLRVGREPGIKAGASDEDVLRLSDHDGPRLVTSAKLVAGGTLVARIAREDANGGGKRSGWRWCGLVVGRLGLEQTGEDVRCFMEVELIKDGVLGCCSV